jgi:hypothetical protein
MGLRISTMVLSLAVLAGPIARSSCAQITLADDIILAAQGKENAERNRRTSLGSARFADQSVPAESGLFGGSSRRRPDPAALTTATPDPATG